MQCRCFLSSRCTGTPGVSLFKSENASLCERAGRLRRPGDVEGEEAAIVDRRLIDDQWN